MFRFILLSLFLCCISASHYYPEQHYGYNKFHNGFKKGGIDAYNSEPYGHYGNNYGYGYGYKKPYYHTRYHRRYLPPIIKRLPPIYKDVKQPVYIEQPVIIRKIPVIHKRKEVTIKKLPPIIKDQNPTFVEKEIGVKPEIHEMPKEKIMPGVDYMDEKMSENPTPEAQGSYDLDKRVKEMTEVNEVFPKDMMREKMKEMKPKVDVEDDSIGDFNPSDFESEN